MKISPAKLLFTLAVGVLTAAWASSGLRASANGAQDDIDAFMERALETRAVNWIELHDYVLDEREQLELRGPGSATLYGFDREYTWYIREGSLIRSPVRYNGVAIDTPRRVEYEQQWLRDEQRREAQATRRDPDDESSTEPRLISEAYFFDFTFEPGNYYFAGRDTLDGHEVVRIEYYPTHLFSDDEPDEDAASQEDQREREFEGKFAKTSLVTMWVAPDEFPSHLWEIPSRVRNPNNS